MGDEGRRRYLSKTNSPINNPDRVHIATVSKVVFWVQFIQSSTFLNDVLKNIAVDRILNQLVAHKSTEISEVSFGRRIGGLNA